ncbi:MAG TPA: hypothetical protein VF131_17845 [Blastocatellia bacterium]|nr:hypothetical protein [Blastocatellia bacterium]
MADIKRPNYFTSQLLGEDDFREEQSYHLDMRRRHNRSLHTWGVVKGLEINKPSASSNQFSVSPGMAIDSEGREIVLLDESPPISLSAITPANPGFIIISYSEVEAGEDKYSSGVLSGKYKRITERPKIEVTLAAADDGSAVKLARVTVTQAGLFTIDESARKLASSKLAADSDLDLHNVSISGKLTLGPGARLGVGTNNPGAPLHVAEYLAVGPFAATSSGGGIDLTGAKAVLSLMNQKLTSWPTDPKAGDRFALFNQNGTVHLWTHVKGTLLSVSAAGDVGIGMPNPNRALTIFRPGAATQVFESLKNESNELLIGVDASVIVSAMTASDLQIRTNNKTRMTINANSGNVGIGTTEPGAPMHIAEYLVVGPFAASSGIGGIDVNGPKAELGFVKRTLTSWPTDPKAGDRFVWYNPDGTAHLWTHVKGALLSVTATGNVGIGTTTPEAPLHVVSSLVVGPYSTNVMGGIELTGNAGGRLWLCKRTINDKAAWPANPAPGDRFVLHNPNGTLRIATEDLNELVAITATGNVGIGTSTPAKILDVAGRMRVRHGPGDASDSAGIWFAHPAANPDDRAFVGMKDDNNVGFWGNTNANWGLFMDTTTGNVTVTGKITADSYEVKGKGGKGGYVMDQFLNKLGEELEQGDIVVIGENQVSLYYGTNNAIPIPEVDLARDAYDTRVCGIVCDIYGKLEPEDNKASDGETQKPKQAKKGKGAATVGRMRPREFTNEELNALDTTKVGPDQIGWMATLGAYSFCKVDADIAPIKVGDLLTTSPTKGHAQKVLDPAKATGAIIGKALGPLKKGKGKIPVIVLLQ